MSPRSQNYGVALALVFVGGALGTASREAITLAFPSTGDLPSAVWSINVVGSFALGILLGLLSGRSSSLRHALALAAGTGFCGGFTTYSTLATGAASLTRHDAAVSATIYGLGSVLLGAAAAWLGLIIGEAVSSKRLDAASETLMKETSISLQEKVSEEELLADDLFDEEIIAHESHSTHNVNNQRHLR